MVNALLIVIWAIAGGGFFWPVFPLMGWGIGMVFHAWDTYSRPPSDDRIRRDGAPSVELTGLRPRGSLIAWRTEG